MREKKDTFLHLFGILWAAAVILTCANSILQREGQSEQEEEPE